MSWTYGESNQVYIPPSVDSNIKSEPSKDVDCKKVSIEEFEAWKKKAEEQVKNNDMKIGFIEISDNDSFPLG